MIHRLLVVLIAALLLSAPAWGQPARTSLVLESGAGRVITLDEPVANVFVADPKVAEVRPASPTALFVFGLAPGRTTVAAMAADGRVLTQQQVTIQPSQFAAGQAAAALARLLPGTSVKVAPMGRALVLSGRVTSPIEAARAEAIARGFADPGETVLNDITVQSDMQVTLQVRIVEMSRSVTRSLGINWTALGTIGSIGKLPALNTALNGGAAVVCASGTLLSVACQGLNLSAMVDALAKDELVHILAEPNLTVMSGQTASFLAGGEFPIPVGQQNGQITVEFKRFGVQLAFVPTVLDEGRINLRVSPEVSQLSQEGAVQITAGNSSISIPALTVRRAETTVELGSGQSFAIAGLLQDSSDRTNTGLPELRSVPILGQLFRSDNFQHKQTELVILVTPIIVRPVSDPMALSRPDSFTPVAAGDANAAFGKPAPPPPQVVPLAAVQNLPGHRLPAGVPAGAGFIVQ